ncbi:MAG: AI-2E family transporter, partial [Cytophagaceae bacterium]
MNPKSLDAIVLRYVSFGVLFVGVAVMLFMVRGVLPVFLVGGVIAYAFEPLLQKLEKRGRSRPKAVAFVFGLYILLLLVLFSLLASAVQQGQTLVQPESATQQFERVTHLVQTNQEKLQKLPLLPAVRDAINNTINNSTQNLTARVPALAQDLGLKLVTGTGGFLISVFLITLVSFGLMLEAQRIKGRVLMLIPAQYRRDVTQLSTSINELLGRYVRGQLIVCGTFGALCTVAFEILSRTYGMEYPLILGAIAACIYILPYIGMAVVTISAGLTAYLTADNGQNVQCAAIAVGCCIGFNLFVDYGIAPRVLGRGVGLHPLMVIFALLCGFELGGPLGTVVAVPIFASLRVIFIYLFPQLASPLPDGSPEATSQGKPHSQISEMGERVA